MTFRVVGNLPTRSGALVVVELLVVVAGGVGGGVVVQKWGRHASIVELAD